MKIICRGCDQLVELRQRPDGSPTWDMVNDDGKLHWRTCSRPVQKRAKPKPSGKLFSFMADHFDTPAGAVRGVNPGG